MHKRAFKRIEENVFSASLDFLAFSRLLSLMAQLVCTDDSRLQVSLFFHSRSRRSGRKSAGGLRGLRGVSWLVPASLTQREKMLGASRTHYYRHLTTPLQSRLCVDGIISLSVLQYYLRKALRPMSKGKSIFPCFLFTLLKNLRGTFLQGDSLCNLELRFGASL